MTATSQTFPHLPGGSVAWLREVGLFSDLSDQDLDKIKGCCERRTIAKQGYLFHEGDAVQGFFVLQSGVVNVHRVTEGGREQMVRLFQAGESFAEAVLGGMERYPVSARAEADVTAILIRRAELIQVIRHSPELALRIIASMSGHLHHLITRLELVRDSSVSERLRLWLINHCPKPLSDRPVTIHLPGTKTLLASELGTVAETLSRALACFRDRGWITVEGREITVLRPTKLASLTSG
jgi:CRP-like cAMP-binding protein